MAKIDNHTKVKVNNFSGIIHLYYQMRSKASTGRKIMQLYILWWFFNEYMHENHTYSTLMTKNMMFTLLSHVKDIFMNIKVVMEYQLLMKWSKMMVILDGSNVSEHLPLLLIVTKKQCKTFVRLATSNQSMIA